MIQDRQIDKCHKEISELSGRLYNHFKVALKQKSVFRRS